MSKELKRSEFSSKDWKRVYVNIDTDEEWSREENKSNDSGPIPQGGKRRKSQSTLTSDHTRTCVSSQLLHHFLCLQVPDVDHVVLRPGHNPLPQNTTLFTPHILYPLPAK